MSRSLPITVGGSVVNLSVPEEEYLELERLRNGFVSREIAPTHEARIPSPVTSERVCLRFVEWAIRFASQKTAAAAVLSAFEQRFLKQSDIHTIAAQPPATAAEEKEFLRSYYNACEKCGRAPQPATGALLQAAANGDASVFAAFGGQGPINSVCLQELKELYRVYRPLLSDLFDHVSPLLERLSSAAAVSNIFEGNPIRVKAWLSGTRVPPLAEDLATAPYSFPLIGLLGLCHYVILCKVAGLTPGEMRSRLVGVTGHSQGVAVATVVALADTWSDFYRSSNVVTELLLWIGYYSQISSPKSPLSAKLITDSVDHAEGEPSNMLSIRGLRKDEIDALVNTVNESLSAHEKVYVALQNTASNFVIAGPAHSLHGVNKYIRSIKASNNEDQSRVPFDKRKPNIHHQFLPITAPFHTPYLADTATQVKQAMSATIINSSSLSIPVLDSNEAPGLHQSQSDNILHDLIDSICTRPVDWPFILKASQATHIVSLDAGGIGNMIVQMADGSNVRTVFGNEFGRSDTRVGRKSDLFSPSYAILHTRPQAWSERFAPRIERSAAGQEKLSTKLTRLLGLPHVTVAAMTPTTAHWDVVSAIMNAGYHAELAGGGYYSDESMTTAIQSLVTAIPKGHGITCNIIYSSPHSVQWQVPMLRRLKQEGIPIDGLSIGAGIPSPEVMEDYITTLGLRHITLKPGSRIAIQETIAIAAMNPNFPIIMQWTGGRSGGHHSYEDFHDPILEFYAEIRQHDNIVLVAGSGFGGADDTYPYLTGSWSADLYDRPAMPFDGILMGSRMMVAKEAHTSEEAKTMICACSGTVIDEWTDSYNKIAGGVISVKSEMGQPIHKVATRGVMFWAEMDKVFALPRERMAEQIQRKKSYIIKRLNADFAKPYFGKSSTGQPIEVAEMTYAEIILRMIELMYVRHQNRWIDKSYEEFVCDMIRRTTERLGGDGKECTQSITEPYAYYERFVNHVTDATMTIIDPDDEAYFLSHCKKRGQKPVNFVPVIDENLETWMKKDSLWQSEDIDAVVDQDVGRVCILQGPVAAGFSVRTDESAGEILDRICSTHVEMLKRDQKYTTDQGEEIEVLGQPNPAIQALCSAGSILRGRLRIPNPLRRILQLPACISTFNEEGSKLIISNTAHHSHRNDTVEVEAVNDKVLTVRLRFCKPGSTEASSLELDFTWHSDRPFDQIEEQSETRNLQVRNFYGDLWLGSDYHPGDARSTFEISETLLTSTMAEKITRSIRLADAAHLRCDVPTDLFPLDGLIMVTWKILVKPLLNVARDGDLLNLVHLSNKTEYLSGVDPLKIGDAITATSQISSLSITSTGKAAEVRVEIYKSGKPVASIVSEFLFRGSYHDFDRTFRDVEEPEMEMRVTDRLGEAILKSRDWFSLDAPTTTLVGKMLVFHLRTSCTWEDAEVFSSLTTSGVVSERINEDTLAPIARVNFQADHSHGNPVVDLLRRKGQLVEKSVKLKQPGWDGDEFYEVEVPDTNEGYSVLSGDYNPIHTSPIFAAWVGLPSTITHGMYTSAIVRNMLESIICNGDRKLFRSFTSHFTGMVIPQDVLQVAIQHVGMQHGCKVFDIKVVKEGSREMVLSGQAVIEEVPTTFIFTGQGSQAQGMGMDLYESSPVAKKLWDDADKFLMETYGWSILQIVRENPKSLTVYFGGKRGREIRNNYRALNIQNTLPDGTIVTQPILTSVTPTSTSYTFSEPRGLLYSTQFAQPAITLVSKAMFEDMRSKGLIPPGSSFAGHSLGEYAALAAFTDFIPFHTLMSVVFYRGLTMQVAMERDEQGLTDFAMVAINPSRIGKWFCEQHLRRVLLTIATATHGLLEIVNFNIKGEQYVAAGQRRNLYVLAEVMNYLHAQGDGCKQLEDFMTAADDEFATTTLGMVILNKIAEVQQLTAPFVLTRGKATIPLKGIDVPFHSTYLRPSVPAYRRYLEEKLKVEDIVPERFLQKFIPNVMAKPFQLDAAYFAEAAGLTDSAVLKHIAETGKVAA